MTNFSVPNPRRSCSRICSMAVATVLLGCLVNLSEPTSVAQAAPNDTKTEKPASIADSDARKWANIDGSRYRENIRVTSRITYPDAGRVPQVSCDINSDGHSDMIFLDQEKHQIHLLYYIPYGSDQEETQRPIAQQPGAVHVELPAGGGQWQLSCVKRSQDERPVLAVANQNRVFVSELNKFENHQPFPIFATYTFDSEVKSLAPLTPGLDTPGILVATKNKAYLFDRIENGTRKTAEAAKSWDFDTTGAVSIFPLNNTLRENTTIGIGLPAQNRAYAISAQADSGRADTAGTVIQGNAGNFGTSMVAIGDVNGDDLDDYAIGAPTANNGAGAVAIVYGSRETTGRINVEVSSVSPNPVSRDGKAAGTLVRQANRGRIGTSLAYVPPVDVDNPGALVISRPDAEEHPGAVIVSEKALRQNWNTGGGLDSIPSSQAAVLASEENTSGDGGFYVGTVPAADTDTDLVGVYTADTKGKVDVWTVDMRRQNGTTPAINPLYPQPPAPSATPAYQPVDEADQKSWLGEFTAGLGGTVAKGSCDVTGDGKPDLITGGATRSEYKFDPYYEDSTPTHGWVFNVTGQVQVIPGGTPGGSVAGNDKIISILGPRKTQDPATDAAVGFSVACLGDVNGDGIDDMATSSVTMGRIWVIYGGKDLAQTRLDDIDPSRGYTVNLPFETGSAGFQVTRVGDVDGDSHADLGFVVSNTPLAMGDTTQTYGSAFIVKGNSQGKTIDLSDLNAPNPDVIWRVDTPRGHTLSAFTPVGDVNADGIVDYVLADFNSFSAKGTVPGAAWVVYGNQTRGNVNLQGSFAGYGLVMSAEASYRLGAGNSIASAGDVNGDGIGDFVIGFDGGTINHQTEGGVALVLGTKGAIRTRSIDPAPGKTDKNIRLLTGASRESGFGWAVDAIPVSPANPTGLLAVGAGGQGRNGAAYVLRLTDVPAGVTPVSALGNRVFVIASTGERSRFGRAVAFVGNYLGEPTLAIGGDGVIDNAATGEEGYAHSAHILAIATRKITDRFASGDIDAGAAIPSSGWSSDGALSGGTGEGTPSRRGNGSAAGKPATSGLSVFDKQFTKPLVLTAGAVKRVAGANRVETSLQALSLVKNHETVVLTAGADFPDALVGGALAGALKAGLVLTTAKGGLEPSVLAALRAQGTKTVRIVGGVAALGGAKEDSLRTAGFQVIRIAGRDRYETARMVKEATRKALGLRPGAKEKLSCKATGVSFPDALACASAAALLGGTVDLVKPGQAVTPDATAERTVCAGGEACKTGGVGVSKLVGSDRYETAYKMAELAPAVRKVMVVNARNTAADSLVASALPASIGARLVFSDGTRVNVPAGTNSLQLVGDQAVLPDNLPVFAR